MMTDLAGKLGNPDRSQQAGKADFARFEILEGSRRIACTVSDEALDAVSGLEHPTTPSQRRDSFSRFRTLINEAARLKAASTPGEWSGKIMILGPSDLRRVPPRTGTPLFGVATRQKVAHPH